jgi:hypothetical protein
MIQCKIENGSLLDTRPFNNFLKYVNETSKLFPKVSIERKDLNEFPLSPLVLTGEKEDITNFLIKLFGLSSKADLERFFEMQDLNVSYKTPRRYNSPAGDYTLIICDIENDDEYLEMSYGDLEQAFPKVSVQPLDVFAIKLTGPSASVKKAAAALLGATSFSELKKILEENGSGLIEIANGSERTIVYSYNVDRFFSNP